jgi:hypothetical protein
LNITIAPGNTPKTRALFIIFLAHKPVHFVLNSPTVEATLLAKQI